MRVTLIRHGEAGDDAPRDELRALTVRGRADMRRVGRALARRGTRFSVIVSSPLVRALQTAEIVAAALDYRARILASDALVPEASASATLRLLLESLAGEKSVALVGHEPNLSSVAAALTKDARQPLRKGEALRIRLPGEAGEVGKKRWRIDPASGRRERL